MAHIQRVSRAGGKFVYRARWTDDNGIERSRTFQRRRDAKAFLDNDREEYSVWIMPGTFMGFCPECGYRLSMLSAARRDRAAARHEDNTGHGVWRARGVSNWMEAG